jgi:hypothetical protein
MKTFNKWMVSFLVVACISITLPPCYSIRVQAMTRGPFKVSPDLAQLIQTDPGNSHRKLIVQFNETPLLEIEALLLGLGGIVTRQLNGLGIDLVDLPLDAVGTPIHGAARAAPVTPLRRDAGPPTDAADPLRHPSCCSHRAGGWSRPVRRQYW